MAGECAKLLFSELPEYVLEVQQDVYAGTTLLPNEAATLLSPGARLKYCEVRVPAGNTMLINVTWYGLSMKYHCMKVHMDAHG